MASGFASPYYAFKGKAIAERDFEQHFSIDLMVKDQGLMLAEAHQAAAPMPGLAAIREVFQAARAQGRGQEDIAAVFKVLEKAAGVRTPPGPGPWHPREREPLSRERAHRGPGRDAFDGGRGGGGLCVREPPARGSSVDPAALQALESVSRDLGQVQLRAVGARPHPGRPAPGRQPRPRGILQLTDATQACTARSAWRTRRWPRSRPIEQGRPRQMESSRTACAGWRPSWRDRSTRGAAGENILACGRWPSCRPTCSRSTSPSATSRRVRAAAARRPVLPIDSKWTSVGVLERLERRRGPAAGAQAPRRAGRAATCAAASATWRSTSTPSARSRLGLLAVPDAVYAAAPEAHAEGYREGVLSCPIRWPCPTCSPLYRLDRCASAAPSTPTSSPTACARLDESLRKMDEEVEGRLSRGLVQVENSRDALREHVADARRTTERLLRLPSRPKSSRPRRRPPLRLRRAVSPAAPRARRPRVRRRRGPSARSLPREAFS